MPISLDDLATLWVNNGGNPAIAAKAAAISDAENESHNPNSDVADPEPNDPTARSVGLWQINSPNWPGLSKMLGIPITEDTLKDPNTNAKAAIALAGKSGAGFSNWTTWTAYQKELAGGPVTRASTIISEDLAGPITPGGGHIASTTTATAVPATVTDWATLAANWITANAFIVTVVAVALIVAFVLFSGGSAANVTVQLDEGGKDATQPS